jgi:hypothetical protein
MVAVSWQVTALAVAGVEPILAESVRASTREARRRQQYR